MWLHRRMSRITCTEHVNYEETFKENRNKEGQIYLMLVGICDTHEE